MGEYPQDYLAKKHLYQKGYLVNFLEGEFRTELKGRATIEFNGENLCSFRWPMLKSFDITYRRGYYQSKECVFTFCFAKKKPFHSVGGNYLRSNEIVDSTP